MAYDDYYTGYESAFVPTVPVETEEERIRREEEERKRREAESKQVVQSQQVQTRADGTQVVTTKTERRPQIQPVAPSAMPQPPRVQGVPGPVDIFNRMIQAESGGRQYDLSGNILTSPKGAQGMAQIMPATAAQPGFGIRPATPQEIATPEGNRAFGERYFQGMLNLFGGDQQKAAAAYNAGPGRVQQAERMAAERGGSFLSYLPQETIKYVGQVFSNLIPSAQAGELTPEQRAQQRAPVQPVAPAAEIQQQPPIQREPVATVEPSAQGDIVNGVQTGRNALQPVAPTEPAAAPVAEQPSKYALTAAPAPMGSSQPYIDRYQTVQDNPTDLMKLATDDTAPEWLRDRARNRAADLTVNQRNEQQAQKQLAAATPTDLARMMTERKKEGSWAKYLLFGALGMTALRDQEASKLGIGTDKLVTDADGKTSLIKIGPDGSLIEGFGADGRQLTPEELVKAGGSLTAGAKNLDIVGGTYVNDKTGEVGRVVTDQRSGQSYVQTDTGRKPMAGFRPQGQGGTLDMQRVQQIQRQNVELAGDWAKLQMRVQGAAPEAANKYIGEFNAKHGTNFGVQSVGGAAPQISLETGQMIQGAPVQAAPQQAPAMAAPAAAPQQAPAMAPAAPAQPVAPTAPAAVARPTAVAPVVPGAPTAAQTPAAIESARKAEEERRKQQLELGTTEQTQYIKETVPTVGQTASDGLAVSNARRQQLDIIRRNPSIVNIMNGQGTTYDQARRIIIKTASGAYGAEERQQLNQDLGQVMNKLTEAEQGALQEFVNLNTVVNAKTLRANAGPGAVSDAEQRANKEANVGNLDSIPAYAALAGLHRSQFNGDLAASKQNFMTRNPQIKTTNEFNAAWQREEALRLKEYQAIAKARFDIMGRAPTPNAGAEAIAAYRDRVFRAFEAYPAPQFDPATGRWNYQTANARRAAMAAVLGQ